MVARSDRGAETRRRAPLMVVASTFLLITGLLGTPAVTAAQVRDGVGTDVTPTAVVAPPDGANNGFAPNVLAIAEGGSIDVVGADTASHNLACVKRSRKTKRPLCQSAFASAGQTVPVVGVEKLPAGTYALVCQLHPKMTVNLTII